MLYLHDFQNSNGKKHQPCRNPALLFMLSNYSFTKEITAIKLICLFIQCLPISFQRWKDFVFQTTHVSYLLDIVCYIHVICYIINVLHYYLRHANVQDAVAVNSKVDFRCQHMIRPSFHPTGIVFSTSVFHFDS